MIKIILFLENMHEKLLGFSYVHENKIFFFCILEIRIFFCFLFFSEILEKIKYFVPGLYLTVSIYGPILNKIGNFLKGFLEILDFFVFIHYYFFI